MNVDSWPSRSTRSKRGISRSSGYRRLFLPIPLSVSGQRGQSGRNREEGPDETTHPSAANSPVHRVGSGHHRIPLSAGTTRMASNASSRGITPEYIARSNAFEPTMESSNKKLSKTPREKARNLSHSPVIVSRILNKEKANLGPFPFPG